MATHEHRLQKIRAHVQDAHDELHALPAEDRQPFESGLARLDDVVAHAGVVLDAADPRLVSTRAFASIQSAACAIANDPRAALQVADAHADALDDAVALLPVTRKELGQQVTAAAEEFGKSSAERIDTLRREVERWSSSLDQSAERQAAVDAKLAEAEEALASLNRRHGEAFAASERRRAAEFRAQLEAFRAEHARGQQEAFDEAQARVAEIRRMEQETAALVGAIGVDGTSEIYRRQGRRQRRAAEILRCLAVLAGLGAVAIALAGATVTDPTAESLVASLFASLMLAGLAAYLAHQSGRHRAREERTSALELELAAFGPFIEPLGAERREEERVIMARKLFPTPDLTHASNGAATNGVPSQ